MKHSLITIGWLVLILSVACIASAGSGVLVNLRVPENPYAVSRLDEKVDLYFSAVNNIVIRKHETTISTPNEIDRVIDFDELLILGSEQSSRYIFDLNFEYWNLETRKSAVLPHLITRFRVYAVISGWLRIIDIEDERLVKLKRVEFEVKAKDRWQFANDDQHDADLLVPPDKKIVLFEKLDEIAAEGIYNELVGLLNEE